MSGLISSTAFFKKECNTGVTRLFGVREWCIMTPELVSVDLKVAVSRSHSLSKQM